MRVAIYVRVSTLEQYKEGYSVSEQIERLTKYCEAKGWTVYKVYIDGGYSGASMERPALQDMIRDAGLGLFGAVLVYKLDRLSRSQRDTLEIIEDILLPSNIEFVSMTENLDTSSPFGRAMIGILSVFAQLEREQIKERMAIGIEGRAKDGKWHGSRFTPVGYEYKDGKLEINEYEAMLVREAFNLFVNRVPVNRICSEFKKKGYKHRYGYWVPPTLKNALRNKVYLGYINHGGESYKGQHDPIVSEETFEKAQRIFEERNKDNPSYKNAFKYSSYLGGLLYCKHCGARFCKQNGWKKNNGEQTHHYTCYSRSKKSKSRIKNPNCKNKIWNMKVLDNKVFEEVMKLSFDPNYIELIREGTKPVDDKPQQVEILNKRIEELTARISRYSDLYSLGQMDMNEIKAKVDPLTSERQSLKDELSQIQRVADVTAEETIRLANSFGEALVNGDFDETKFILEELIEKIELDNEKVTVFWNFA